MHLPFLLPSSARDTGVLLLSSRNGQDMALESRLANGTGKQWTNSTFERNALRENIAKHDRYLLYPKSDAETTYLADLCAR